MEDWADEVADVLETRETLRISQKVSTYAILAAWETQPQTFTTA